MAAEAVGNLSARPEPALPDRQGLRRSGVALSESVRSDAAADRHAETTAFDLDLVRRAQAGDEHAFGQLVERNRRAVYRAAFAALGSAEDADDVAQETFVTVYQKLSGFRAESSFKTWLLAIAWRKALDRRRSVTRWLRMTMTHDRLPDEDRTRTDRPHSIGRTVAGRGPGVGRPAARGQATDRHAAPEAARRAAARRLRRLLVRTDWSDAGHSTRHGEMAGFGSAAGAEEEADRAGLRT